MNQHDNRVVLSSDPEHPSESDDEDMSAIKRDFERGIYERADAEDLRSQGPERFEPDDATRAKVAEAIEENTKLCHDLERATENHSADLSAVSATPPRATAKGLPDYPLELVPGCKWPACDCPGRWDCSATADRTASKEGK